MSYSLLTGHYAQRELIEENNVENYAYGRQNLVGFLKFWRLFSTVSVVTLFYRKHVLEFFANLTSNVGYERSEKYGKVFVHGKVYTFNPDCDQWVLQHTDKWKIRLDPRHSWDHICHHKGFDQMISWPSEEIGSRESGVILLCFTYDPESDTLNKFHGGYKTMLKFSSPLEREALLILEDWYSRLYCNLLKVDWNPQSCHSHH